MNDLLMAPVVQSGDLKVSILYLKEGVELTLDPKTTVGSIQVGNVLVVITREK